MGKTKRPALFSMFLDHFVVSVPDNYA
jgi:hypothetical protein